ncbi:MAG TPA: carboxypeptidase-like regulatory domain-containing protein [Terriglobia bacterium]|nr:carboxypeptidase-like regulatory domain-containing protein [Terriglobia bacterium]
MFRSVNCLIRTLCTALFLQAALSAQGHAITSWNGVLKDSAGAPVAGAVVRLHSPSGKLDYSSVTSSLGAFSLDHIVAGGYLLSASKDGETWRTSSLVVIKDGLSLTAGLRMSAGQDQLQVMAVSEGSSPRASGGENLSSKEVSSLPLNERDFSKLLLLAAGTMTDTNGSANFTQQFAVNGQRATATVFAMDGIDTTDPEMGGATFPNFNVDAIREVQASSGVMPAEIGHGAASYTNVVTKSGTNRLHGSVFEFVRNSAFDARNFFDRQNVLEPRRIPPFTRNEFGLTMGGPVVIPGVYNGRNGTFFFGEYQGFRQVLGTTQVFAVPTMAERNGIDTTAYAGDTLTVPVSQEIVPVLNGYPMPNDPQGSYGARTYATSSKVFTGSDQFSIRLDHQISGRSSLYARFSYNQINGPTTNPDQTAIDPSFAIKYFDHQRNAGLKYSRVWSPHLTSDTSFGYTRSTPFFPSINHTQPAMTFSDGLYEPFNSADGSITGSFGNLFQFKHDMADIHGKHTFKWGVEIRVNRDATIWGVNPNGLYTFGGGTAYSPVTITSASGQRDVQPGDPLPDALTGFLTATPYLYTISALSDITPGGNRFDEAGVRRQTYNLYFQDSWKATTRLAVNYGFRYETNSRIAEVHKRTSSPLIVGQDGASVPFWTSGAKQVFVVNPQPPYTSDWSGWGPRLSIDYRLGDRTVLHAGGAITTLLTNLWQDNFLTGNIPFLFTPYASAVPGVPVPFSNSVTHVQLPPVYTPDGQPVFPTGNTADVVPNTPIDIQRFQNDLAALTPGNQIQLLSTFGIARDFRNGYIETYTAGLDHDFGHLKFSANYVATAGVHLASIFSPNSYSGASPGFAPFTQFNSSGQATGGFGSETLMTTRSHSTYHSLQTSLSKNSTRWGLGFQASYTFSKSLDDTSSALGAISGGPGVVLQSFAQNPWDPGAEKGPSYFDVTHIFALSLIQALPVNRVNFLRPLGKHFTDGWQLLNITTLMTGLPFTVYSGIQQTGAGTSGADRPDQIAQPGFSTSRTVREDFFGRGANNASFFSTPIHVAGGTGPNQGVFGTLGRNTFRGPQYHNLDVALIKDTSFGRRGAGELGILQFRAEFFNVFNLVNFGIPSNVLRGSGFGIVSKTAGTSRQIQFSVRLIY